MQGETTPFKPYSNRYPVPYVESKSTSPFWYSIKRASAYIIVLSSYSAYGKYTPQYQWLQHELPKVNRTETAWLIVLMHAPWYNSFNYPFMEGETMRVIYERWFVKYKVDVVFSGHVHAYERSVSSLSMLSPLVYTKLRVQVIAWQSIYHVVVMLDYLIADIIYVTGTCIERCGQRCKRFLHSREGSIRARVHNYRWWRQHGWLSIKVTIFLALHIYWFFSFLHYIYIVLAYL